MNIRMHTGCGCWLCKRGRDKKTRALFHRKLRKLQKRQLKKDKDITDATVSIGYTD